MTKVLKINEKAKSKSQQRLFGMVTAYKDGKLDLEELPDSLAKKIKDIANGKRKKTGDKRKKTKGISKTKAKDYASTKHKGLPETIDENNEFDRENYIDLICDSSRFSKDRLDKMSDEELKDLYKTLEVDDFDDQKNGAKEFNIYEDKEEFNREECIDLIYSSSTFEIDELEEMTDNELKKLTKSLEIDSFNKELEDEKLNIYEDKSILKFDDFVNESNTDVVEIKEPMSIEEIAKKHDVAIEYIESILPISIDIEMEHTDDPDLALKIALHHLEESILYYDDKIGLPNMEEELEDLKDDEIEDIVEDRLKNKIVKFDEFTDEEND
jgi:uncharacterized protein DUF5661